MQNAMKTLLDKTRKINRSIQQSSGYQMDFDTMSQVLADVLGSNVFILSRRGKILGSCLNPGFEPSLMEEEILQDGRVSAEYNAALLRIDNTLANNEAANICQDSDFPCPFSEKTLTVAPLMGGGERLGTLILGKNETEFDDADLVLAEYGATVVGMEIVRSRGDKLEEEVRKKAPVKLPLVRCRSRSRKPSNTSSTNWTGRKVC